MKKKLTKLLALTLVFTLLLIGCTAAPAGKESDKSPEPQSQAQTEPEGEKEKLLIGFSNWSRSFEFYVDMETGMKEKADELGVEVIMQDPNGDLNAQTEQLENFISRKVDGIIICAIDSEASGSEVEMVNAAGIPIITCDIACTGGGKTLSHVASDNYLGGKLAAEYIGEYLKGKGKVAVIDNPTITPLIERRDGFLDTIKEKYPEIEVVSVQSGESTREKGMEVAENMLEKHPDLAAIFGTNDMMGLGAVQAIQAKNMDTIVVGFDATAEACTVIKENGPMKASIAQQPKLLGATALETIVKCIKGEAVDELINVEVMTVSSENISDFAK